MTTEQRQNFRLHMKLECAMNIGDQGFRPCKTRDISQEGAFIVGDTAGLALNSLVTLAVQTISVGHKQVHHFRTHVRHVTATGVGLYIKDARVLMESILAKGALGGGQGGMFLRSSLLS